MQKMDKEPFEKEKKPIHLHCSLNYKTSGVTTVTRIVAAHKKQTAK